MKIAFLLLMFLSLETFATVYEQACHVIGEDDYVKYSIITTGLETGHNFTLSITAFEDEACTLPYLQYDQHFSIAAISNENINLIAKEISYKPLTLETADALNLLSYCGVDGWKNQNPVVVTGQLCNDYQQLSQGQHWFQILKASVDSLSLGLTTEELDGRAESRRPGAYDLIYEPARF